MLMPTYHISLTKSTYYVHTIGPWNLLLKNPSGASQGLSLTTSKHGGIHPCQSAYEPEN